ncbi:MAG: hypothetical protein ACLVJ6_14305 [Merdibacter sp.]
MHIDEELMAELSDIKGAHPAG